MGELILCSQMLAALPYYIDNAGLNVYSLEELSYYIEQNTYLLEPDFMNLELCAWVEQELGLGETAEKLREMCQKGGTLSEFVVCLLSQSGYCSREGLHLIEKTLQEMEHKSEFECCKIRADRYMENQKYISGIYEYRKILQMEEEIHDNPLLAGNVWHNLGSAYARLFLFQVAGACFEHAYQLNQNPESLRACLYAYRCLHDEHGFLRIAEENCVDEQERETVKRSLTDISRMDRIKDFETELEKMFRESAGGSADCADKIRGMVETWKDEYRKNCRV